MHLKVYTDGSFGLNGNKNVGFAAVFVIREERYSAKTYILYGATSMPLYTSSRNVGGEILAVEMALQFVNNRDDIDGITIYHDYTGVGEWANRNWMTNKDLTKEYVKRVTEYKNSFNIDFQHVRGHSGDIFNNLADEFSKKGSLMECDEDVVFSEKELTIQI